MFQKHNSAWALGDQELKMMGLGSICGRFIARKNNREAGDELTEKELKIGMAYTVSLQQLLQDKTAEPGLLALELREYLLALPSVDIASLDEVALEDDVIMTAVAMHYLWQITNDDRLSDPSYADAYRHLPLTFLKWEDAQHLIGVAKDIYVRLGVSLDSKRVKRAFYEAAAQSFRKYAALVSAPLPRPWESPLDFVAAVAVVDNEMTRPGADYWLAHRREPRSIDQLKECVISIDKMSECALRVEEALEKRLSRPELDKQLAEILDG